MAKYFWGLFMLLLVVGLAAPAGAAGDGDEPWQLVMPTYLWAPGIDGDMTVAGNTADLSIGPHDVLENTDIAIMLYLELRKPTYGFFLEANYFQLGVDRAGSTPLGGVRSLEYQQDLVIVSPGAFIEVINTGGDRPFVLDAIAGMRYWNMKNQLILKGPIIGKIRGEDTAEIYDPLIGVRGHKYLTEKVGILIRGDIGGFNMGHQTSDFSWQALGTLGYDLGRYFTLFGGYRALAVDYEEGRGASRNGFDLILHGPILGFNWDIFGWLNRNKQ
jgi:hypothetical protein